MDRLVDIVDDEDIFNPPTVWMVDEIAKVLMPFLTSNARLAMPAEEPEKEESDVRELDVHGRPVEVRQADVVNVYNAPVTINNYYAAPALEADASDDATTEEVTND